MKLPADAHSGLLADLHQIISLASGMASHLNGMKATGHLKAAKTIPRRATRSASIAVDPLVRQVGGGNSHWEAGDG